MTSETTIQAFLDYTVLVRGCRPKTAEAYATDLRVWRAFWTASCPKADNPSAPARVIDFIRYLRVKRKNGPSAIQRKLATLSAFIDYLILMELLDPKLDGRSRWPKLLDMPERLPVVLDEQEIKQILAQPDPDTVLGRRDRAILTLLYSAGLRVSEVCGLQIADLNWKKGRILIQGKGGRQRFVPLDPVTEEALRCYINSRSGDIPEVFVSKKGGRLTPRAVQFFVKKYSQAAGVQKAVTPHKLRHTCATHLLKEGAHLVAIQKLLGHKSIATTQVYLHITIQDLKELSQVHPLRRMRVLLTTSNGLPSRFQTPYGERTG
ncbi:MAG: tyrosine-type recombinase/integrase [Actinobacteria bacterium]|nr:tyrosine-type recombinase/integrase [Actinomycetota bacterium]